MKIKWNTNKFFLKCNSNQEVFLQHISTLQHVLLLLHAERLTDNQFLSTCSPTCLPVIVAKASVILAFQFVISGTGVENTLSLTYPHKKKSRGGWYPAIVVARVSDHLSQSTCLEMFHRKTDETSENQCGGAASCWKIIHGWNSSEVQRKVPTCPGSFLVINVCNQGKNLCSPCIIILNCFKISMI